MSGKRDELPEIESFNLADLDVSGLDMRFELTTILPAGQCIRDNCSCNDNSTSCSCNDFSCDGYGDCVEHG
jgi:hypothetical protein